jgi:hypothetical protein
VCMLSHTFRIFLSLETVLDGFCQFGILEMGLHFS